MHFKRQPIGPPKDLQIFDPLYRSSRSLIEPSWNLIPGLLLLNTRSFGAWLEPRYIFGAGRLIDQ